jgi:ribosome-associated protein
MANLIREAIAPPPAARVPTRPSRRAKERRVAEKRHRSTVKRNRRVQPGDE